MRNPPRATAGDGNACDLRSADLGAFHVIAARRGSNKILASATVGCELGEIDVLVLDGVHGPFACVPGYQRDGVTPVRAVRFARGVGDTIVHAVLGRAESLDRRGSTPSIAGVGAKIPLDSALARSRRTAARENAARRAQSARWFAEQERRFEADRSERGDVS